MPSVLDAQSPVNSPDPGKESQEYSVTANKNLTELGVKTKERSTIRSTPKPEQSRRSIFLSVCIVATCTSSMVMNIAMGPTVAILIPYAGKELNIQKNNLQWIVSAYAISSGCLVLLCGRLADLYGRKLVWLVGYSITAVFGIASGFAHSGITLDILRGIQGMGGAATVPASLGILARAFPHGPARSFAFSTYASGGPVGAVFGAVFGSVLTQLTSQTWRSPFYLFSSISFLCMILGFFVIDEDEPSTEEDKRVDWIGAFLITSGLTLIVFVLSDSPTARMGWASPHVFGLFFFGILLVLFFALWQHYLERRLDNPDLPRTRWTAPPLMKLSMWPRAHGRFAVMQIIACVEWAAFTSWVLWVQLYYQAYLNLTPIHTMFRVLPMYFTGIMANVITAFAIGRIDVCYILATGTFMTGCACLLFAIIDPNAPYWAFGFPSACLIALGVDFAFASGTLFISKISLPHEQSVAGALFQAMTQIGSAIGLSVSTIAFNGVLRAESRHLGVSVNQEGDDAPMPAQLKAYQAAMWTGFAFGILCTILCVFLRGVGVVGQAPARDVTSKGGDLADEEGNNLELKPAKPNRR